MKLAQIKFPGTSSNDLVIKYTPFYGEKTLQAFTLENESKVMQHLGFGEAGPPKFIGFHYANLVTNKDLAAFPGFFNMSLANQKTITEHNKYTYLTMEYVPAPNLFEHLTTAGHIEGVYLQYLFRQIVEKVVKTHKKGVAHKDIKLENILLSSKGEIIIIDYGTSRIIQKPINISSQTVIYTPYEFYLQETIPRNYFCFDTFALGTLLFALGYRRYPFYQELPLDIFYAFILNADYEGFWNFHQANPIHNRCIDISYDFKLIDLLNHLFAPEPELRLSLSEIQGHEWCNQPLLPSHEAEKIARESVELIKKKTGKDER